MLAGKAAAAGWNALRAKPLATLLVASAALKLVYVFFCTQYASHLFSDFLGYWSRAHVRMAGGDLDYDQWAFWPPLAHILLAWYLRLVSVLGLSARELEAALLLNVAASTAGVALLYGIALETLKSRAWALGVAALYAFTFPLVYFNAFVMSEHGATLLMLAALYLVLRYRGRNGALAAAGVALGIATAMRPGLGVLGLPAVLYLALVSGEHVGALSRATVTRAVAFSCGFFVVVALTVAEVHRISSGRVTGVSANGPLALYFGQCRTAVVHFSYQGYRYWFMSPSNANRPENGVVYIEIADYRQQQVTDLAWRCLREEPMRARVLLQRPADLFFGPLLPGVFTAVGYGTLVPAFRWFFVACALLLPLGFAVRGSHGVSTPALGLVGGMLAVSLAFFAVYSVEHRYLYPLLPFIYVIDAAVLLAALREPRRFLAAGAALAAVLAAIGVVALAAAALRGWGTPPAIHTEIRRYASPLVGGTTEQKIAESSSRRLYSPEGERLWPQSGGAETARAVHLTCMEVRAPGEYEFQVVAAGGFALFVDGRQLLSQRQASLDGAYRWRVPLAAGKHRYELRMDQAIAATATWRRISSPFSEFAPALGVRYVGEPAEDAAFVPPGGC